MTRESQARPLPKKAYAAPRLVRYGDVRTLTQTGSMGTTESMVNQPAKMPSDRSIKENIVKVGQSPFGVGLYLFDYRPAFRDLYGHGRQFGVMADEVETVMPRAVSVHPKGYKMVDYAMLGVRRSAR